MNIGTSTFSRINDFGGTLVKHRMVKCFHPNPNNILSDCRHVYLRWVLTDA
jgi:hypothetical protein